MKKPKKKTIIIILVVLVAVIFVSLRSLNAVKTNQMGISVKTDKIMKQDVKSNIFTSGTVISKNYREISSDLSGKVSKVFVEEGQRVKKGDILAMLDCDELEYEIKQSEIKLEIEKDKLDQLKKEDKANLENDFKNAEIDYEDALNSFEDKKALFEAGAISKSDLEKAESSMEIAYNDYSLAKKKYDDVDKLSEASIQEKEIKALELDINKKKEDIEKSNIISPIDGTITEVNVAELSAIDSYTLMFKIYDMESLEVETNISEYDIGKIKLGQLVKLTNDGIENKEYEGTVTYIAQNASVKKDDQSTETVVKVKIDINDKNTEFRPNFSANVEINTANKEGVLVVPYEAIYTEKDGSKCIFIVKDNKAQKHIIETGIEGDMVVEIIGENFKEEDLVILNPTEAIQDGISVEVNVGI